MSGSPSAYAAALVARGRATPERLAFASGGESLQYGELLAEASALARGLQRAGVAPGDRIALLLPAGLPFVRGFSAAMLAGAVPFAIHPDVAPLTALARVARGKASLALATEDQVASWGGALGAAAGTPIAALERLAEPSLLPIEPPSVDPEDPFYLQMTSGTTGEPRFVIVSHRAFAAWRQQSAGILDAGSDDVLVGWVPPWHVTGLLRFVVLPVVGGTPAHLVPPQVRSLGRWIEEIEMRRATFTSAPDFALRSAVRAVGGRTCDLSSLRLVVSGGESIRGSTISEFESRFGLPGIVRPGYGLAESTFSVTVVRPGEELVVDGRGNVSCGRPLPGVELAIVGPDGDELPPEQEGEIWVRSAALFSGYFGADGDENALTPDGWLATGDWGRTDARGELFVRGRRRVLIKHGGATYAPRELEEAAESVPGVVGSAAVALARCELPEAHGIVLVVESALEAPDLAAGVAEQVARAVRSQVGLFPKEVLVVRERTLPRTASGKIRHVEVRRSIACAELPGPSVLHGLADGWVE
ncbi:MAG: AMP-binding protein [Thermoanaerobaculia bacterium]